MKDYENVYFFIPDLEYHITEALHNSNPQPLSKLHVFCLCAARPVIQSHSNKIQLVFCQILNPQWRKLNARWAGNNA